MARHFSDAELSAFLRGELDEVRMEELAMALETDGALAERLERLDLLTVQIREAFDPVMAMTVPKRLSEAASRASERFAADNVVSLADARTKREGMRYRWTEYAAIAASLALGVVIGGQSGVFGPASDDSGAIIVGSPDGATVASPVAAFLASQGGGETQQIAGLGLARASISFRDSESRLCRQFSIEAAARATDGVACFANGKWAVAAIGTRAIEGGEIRTANGEASAAVLTAVDEMIEGEPLDAEAEKAALGALAR